MPVQLILDGQPKDLGGGFVVRRVLPSAQRQAIGPFLFFDHFGPVTEQPGDNKRTSAGAGRCTPGARFIWWNFVSSRKERIAQAARDWQQQQLGRVPGENESIPLPPLKPLG